MREEGNRGRRKGDLSAMRTRFEEEDGDGNASAKTAPR